MSSQSFVFRLSVWIALIGVIYQVAPGDRSWSTLQEHVPEHPLPPIGQNYEYQLQYFLGGDGITKLAGRFYPPDTIIKDAGAGTGDEETNVASADNSSKSPIIVMAHGLGLTQDCNLDAFIPAFRQAGMAVFTFDYATFGWSEGWPRHQVIPNRHVADLRAALKHVRTTLSEKVDIHRLALWGTSLGGGHVLSVAADDHDVRAVVANVPHVKSALESILGTVQRDPGVATLGLLKVAGALIKGVVNFIVGFATKKDGTTYIPLHGLPGSAAIMQNPGDDEGYGRLVNSLPKDLQWKNRASVSSVVPLLLYRPYNSVQAITSPTLLLPAELDTLCPAAGSQAAAQLLGPNISKLVLLKGLAHFDMYEGEALQLVLKETVAFLREHLGIAKSEKTQEG